MALDSRAVGIIVCAVVLNLLAIFAVCGRLYARRLRKLGLGGDDWTILAVMVLSIFLGAFGIWASVTGVYTTPLRQMTHSKYVISRKVQFTEVLVVHLSVGLIKVSVLLFYVRIFTIPWFRRISNALLALVSIWIVGSFFSVIGAFKDVSTYWTAPPAQIRAYENIHYNTFIVVTAGIDVAFDVIILSLPVFVIRTLHMNTQKKVKVTAVFMLGAFCLVASIVRLYYAKQLVSFTGASVASQAFIESGLNQTLWSRIEVSVSIVAACLPPMGPVFRDSRSLESLLNSVSSVFSKSTSTVGSSRQEKAQDDSARKGSTTMEISERYRSASEEDSV